MNDEVYNHLISMAKKGKRVYYAEIAPIVGLDMANPRDRDAISGILGEISTYEVAQGRPMLSAIVISRSNERPGHGFFALARILKKLNEEADDIQEIEFYGDERERVFSYWSKRRM